MLINNLEMFCIPQMKMNYFEDVIPHDHGSNDKIYRTEYYKNKYIGTYQFLFVEKLYRAFLLNYTRYIDNVIHSILDIFLISITM